MQLEFSRQILEKYTFRRNMRRYSEDGSVWWSIEILINYLACKIHLE